MEASFSIKPDKSCVKYAGYYLSDVIKQHLPDLKAKEIKSVKAVIIDVVFQGIRSKQLSKKLIETFNLEKRTADLLASHATSYLLSKYRQAKCIQSGIVNYKWSQSHIGCHDEQHGKIFSFDSPPLTENEVHANPGELIGCSCVAISQVESM